MCVMSNQTLKRPYPDPSFSFSRANNDCAWYAGDDNWQWCSDYDTASFDAFASCCGCGGGVERIYVCYTDDTDDGAGRRLTASGEPHSGAHANGQRPAPA